MPGRRPRPADHRRQQRDRRRDRARRRRRLPPGAGGAATGAAGGAGRGARRRRSGRWRSAATSPSGTRSRRWPRAALEHFGRIDAVFANAGFGATRGFLEESVEHWRSMVLTNVYGAALTIRATLPHLLERGDGHFLITSSIAGRRALPGSLYSATKWAATAIGESLRGRAAPDARQHSDQGDPDRAGHGRHPLLRQPPRRVGAAGRATSPRR